MPTEKRIQDILDRVKRREDALAPLFERMDEDWRLYTLQPFRPRQGEGIRSEDAYTDPRAQIVGDKLAGAIASARMVVRTEQDADNEEQRDADENYERLGIGLLRIADHNRLNGGGVPVKTELGFRAVTQGGYVAARALLLKDSSGGTVVDVTPIHPRHLLLQPGKNEPVWAAIVTMRSRAEIKDEYPDFKFEDDEPEEDQRVEKVVDYYWKQDPSTGSGQAKYMNAVIVAEKWAKKPQDTFATHFPIVARATGAHSGTAGVSNGQGSLSSFASGSHEVPGIVNFAESVFAPIRRLNSFKNRMMSYRMAMMAKSVRQVIVYKSPDGTKSLEEDMDEDTTEVNIAEGDELDPFPVKELTRDVEVIHGEVNNTWSDATLPEQSFGRLPAPISGNALNILGQSEGQRLEPFIRPVESCLEGVIETLASQFETERYKPVRVSGKTRDRRGFSREISPADIKGHDRIFVELVPELARDRQEAWVTAQIAATPGAGGVPLASHNTIWEDILKLPDADLENERIFSQIARTSSPKTVLMTQLVAASKSGDEQTVQFLAQELERILSNEAMQEMAKRVAFISMLQQNPLAAAAAGPDGANGSNGAGGAGSQPNPFGGIPPEMQGLTGVAPGSVQPSPDAGANTTAPRSTEERANAIGITLARR